MNIGDRVVIKNFNDLWNGKEGILENISNDEYVVLVDFIPGENKKVRQNFKQEYVFEAQESLEEGKKNKKEVKVQTPEPKYSLSSLRKLSDALEADEAQYMHFDKYMFEPYVSNKFVRNLNNLKDNVLKNQKNSLIFIKSLDRFLSNINEQGKFIGTPSERINGIANRYIGKILEVKLADVQGKPIRVLVFLLPGKKIVLGNIFYHSDKNLSASERNSCNDVYDSVFK